MVTKSSNHSSSSKKTRTFIPKYYGELEEKDDHQNLLDEEDDDDEETELSIQKEHKNGKATTATTSTTAGAAHDNTVSDPEKNVIVAKQPSKCRQAFCFLLCLPCGCFRKNNNNYTLSTPDEEKVVMKKKQKCRVLTLLILAWILFISLLTMAIVATVQGNITTPRCETKCIVGEGVLHPEQSCKNGNSEFVYNILSCSSIMSDMLAESMKFTFSSCMTIPLKTSVLVYVDQNPRTQTCDYRYSAQDFVLNDGPSEKKETDHNEIWYQASAGLISISMVAGIFVMMATFIICRCHKR